MMPPGRSLDGVRGCIEETAGKASLLGQKQGPGWFETRLPYYSSFSCLFSPLYFWLTVISSLPSFPCLVPLNIHHRSLGSDHSTPGWRSLGLPFCYFYHTTGVHSGQTHRVEDPPVPRTVDVTRSLYLPPATCDDFVTWSYSTISLSLWTQTNSKQHMLFIPILEKKSCFLWKPMPSRVLLFPRGFGNEWFFLFVQQAGKKKQNRGCFIDNQCRKGSERWLNWICPCRWGDLGPRGWMTAPRRSGESWGCRWK